MKKALTILACALTLTGTFSAWATTFDSAELVKAARAQVGVTLFYDSGYQTIKYPGGDIPKARGVCTDVVIRALRQQQIDLQQLVHEDMKANWSAYPKTWGLKSTDTNIDHRRVPNLEVFFHRRGKSLPISDKAADYRPGDIVTWRLPGKQLPHIGIVSDRKTLAGVPLIIHNIGGGTQEEDMLFAAPIKGHFRYPVAP